MHDQDSPAADPALDEATSSSTGQPGQPASRKPASPPTSHRAPSAASLAHVEIETRTPRHPSQALLQYPARRAALPGLFPRRSINLLIGSVGSGKTTLALSELERYHAEGRFLSYSLDDEPGDSSSAGPLTAAASRASASASAPDQCGALVCSGTLESLWDRIQSLGLLHLSDLSRFPIRAWEPATADCGIADTLTRLHDEMCVAARRPVHLLLVEGIQLMMTDDSITNLHKVRDFYRVLERFCLDRDVTILGTVASPKARRGESYPILGDRCYGSIAWAQEASTLIGVEACRLDLPEELRPKQRRVVVQVRAKADVEVLYTVMQPDGRLAVQERLAGDEEVGAGVVLDERLAGLPEGKETTMKEFLEWAAGASLSRRTVERWVQGRVTLGMLERQGGTRNRSFVKPRVQ